MCVCVGAQPCNVTLFGIGSCLLSANASVSHENLQQQSILLNPHWKLDCCLMTLGSRGVRSLPKHDPCRHCQCTKPWGIVVQCFDDHGPCHVEEMLYITIICFQKVSWRWLKILAFGRMHRISWELLKRHKTASSDCRERFASKQTGKHMCFSCIYCRYLGGCCWSLLWFSSIREIWQEIDLNPKPFQLLECCGESVFLGFTLYVLYVTCLISESQSPWW